jgi:hypothetical protein
LHKSLFGLKQAPRAWYTQFSDYLSSISFHILKVDTSLFILSMSNDIFNLLVYVDDILLTESNLVLLHQLIQLLSLEFKIQDLEIVRYFLGFEVHLTIMDLKLRQEKYVINIIHQAGMSSYRPDDISLSTSKVVKVSNFLFYLHVFSKILVLFSISLLQDQTFICY